VHASEQQFQRELDLPGSVRSSHCCDLAEVGVAEIHLWISVDRMIRHVERLGAELQIELFRKLENLEER
jgi:hypothetical protein